MPIINLILIAVGIFVAIIVGGAVIGVLVNLFQCLIFAAIAAIGLALLARFLIARKTPASRQIIDQMPTPIDLARESEAAARQLEARKRRLGK
jgi:membrane protein implicated in regulation of membrane protease activity